jgi:hypothetical protein
MEQTETLDPTLRRTVWAVGIFGILLTGLALFFGGTGRGLGAFAGAAIAFLNLGLLARSVTKLFAGAGGRYGLVVVLKFGGLIALTYALLNVLELDALGLALGLGALPLGIVAGGGVHALQNPAP